MLNVSGTGCAPMRPDAICMPAKLALARQRWDHVQDYADAKTAVGPGLSSRGQTHSDTTFKARPRGKVGHVRCSSPCWGQ